MNDPAALLQSPPIVAAVGIDTLAAALRDQAIPVAQAAWRPPPPGLEEPLARLVQHGRLEAANRDAINRLTAVRPHLHDVISAVDAFPGITPSTFFHAGPPITWDDASGPLRGALIGAILYEGLAPTAEEAERLANAGGIQLAPCHHHGTVGPMAGVISRSMPVAVVRDAAGDGVAYATLNEGLGRVLRYGAFAPEVIDRLRWMQDVLAPLLAAALHRHGPLDLHALLAQALQMGDDGHNRNRAATSLLLRALATHWFHEADNADGPTTPHDRRVAWRFIDGNDHFALNLIMAAAKLTADAAAGVPGSSLVVAMARNGTTFGIRLAGTGDRWFTAPAPVADGLFLGDYGPQDANPDIGDSSITETVGLGGMAMAAAPAIAGFIGGTAAGALRATRTMYEITLAEHPTFRIPTLEFRGTPLGIDAVTVVRSGIAPVINTGIAGRLPGTGQVGAGVVRPPLGCFQDAVAALAAEIPPG